MGKRQEWAVTGIGTYGNNHGPSKFSRQTAKTASSLKLQHVSLFGYLEIATLSFGNLTILDRLPLPIVHWWMIIQNW